MKPTHKIALAAAAVTGGVALYFSSADRAENGLPSDRLVARAERRDLRLTVDSSGEIEPLVKVDVKSEVSGKIEKISVQPGQTVRPGEPLVRMDEKDLVSERESAETDLEGTLPPLQKALRDYERNQELFSKKLVSKQIFDNSRTDLDIAKNNNEKAQRRLQIVLDRLSKTSIVSPMSGTVLTVPVSEGQVVVAAASVNAGTTLMTIADLSQLSISTLINQVDIAQIRPGHEVTFTTDALPQTPISGRVHFIAPVATLKNNIKGFEVRVLVTENKPEIRPGMSADVVFPVAEATGVLSVPVNAVFFEKNKAVVYLKNGSSGESPARREIKTGLTTFHHAEVKSGLEEGDEILLVPPEVWRDKNKKNKKY